MIDHFPQVIEWVLEAEGGYSNLKADSPTNFGITLQTLTMWRDDKPVTAEDVKNLTRQEAIAIYHGLYWMRFGFDKIQQKEFAYIIFDQAINRGPLQAIKNAQTVLRDHFKTTQSSPKFQDLKSDGILGSDTINAFFNIPWPMFCLAFAKLSQLEYLQIVGIKIEKLPFLVGWTLRIHRELENCFIKTDEPY